jgi:aspartate/methionine/tyrosine aminotransferase
MAFGSVMDMIAGLAAEDSLTYAPSFGIPALRQRWQEGLYEKNPSLAGKAVSLPVVTCGITHGVSVFSDVWVDPGDAIILPDMMWGNYNMIFCVRNDAELVQYPLFNTSGGFNLEALEATVQREAASRDKLVVLLNFPQNPTGYTATRSEGDDIARILTAVARGGTNVIAVFDDAYFGLFYDANALQESLFARLADADPRLLAVKLDGATKENFVWGLRVGFITYGIPVEGDPRPVFEALEKKTAGCVRGNISNASHLSQSILLKSLDDPRYAGEKAEKFDILRRRAARVKEVLADPKYAEAWDPYPFNSGYFMCLRLKTLEAEALRVHLLDTYGVGLISIGSRDLRVAFSCLDEEDVTELFDTILKGVADLTR